MKHTQSTTLRLSLRMIKTPKHYFLLGIMAVLHLSSLTANSQTVLRADGSDTTYQLINAVLAPGNNVVETPDCIHKTEKHIDQVFDSTLMAPVFRFKIHKFPDNDRCKTFDRQRTEIKTYDKSPDHLLATLDETVTYQWKFKLDKGFQPSSKFTHLHQIKAVGGDFDAMPLITITARKGSPNQLELRYAKESSQSTLLQVDLSAFQGEWIEATEVIHFQETGKATYDLKMVRMRDTAIVMSFESSTLQMWKEDASFLRPKWGIYRSLLDSNSLRDEHILFADISIQEANSTSTAKVSHNNPFKTSFPNPVQSYIEFPATTLTAFDYIEIVGVTGETNYSSNLTSQRIDLKSLPAGLYCVRLSNQTTGTVFNYKIVKE